MFGKRKGGPLLNRSYNCRREIRTKNWDVKQENTPRQALLQKRTNGKNNDRE
jgi:hypothetical protein